jgi:hypothetical protein
MHPKIINICFPILLLVTACILIFIAVVDREASLNTKYPDGFSRSNWDSVLIGDSVDVVLGKIGNPNKIIYQFEDGKLSLEELKTLRNDRCILYYSSQVDSLEDWKMLYLAVQGRKVVEKYSGLFAD